MSTINTKDTQIDPNYDPLSDPDMEPVYESEADYEAEMGGYEGEGGGMAAPMTPAELRSILDKLLYSKQITQSQYDKYMGEVNRSAAYSEADRAEILSGVMAEVIPLLAPEGAGGAEGDYFSGAQDVTSQQILELMNQIKSGQVQPIDENISAEQCVSLLNQALKDERSNNETKAAEEFMQVLDAVGGPEAIDPKNLAAQKLGAMPTSIEKDGTIHFDGNAGEGGAELNLKAPGDKSEVVVDNAQNVTLTPKNSTDEVTVHEEGNYYVIETGGDVFKINKDAKINILSDHVSGDVANEEGNLTFGANSSKTKKFFSQAKLTEMSEKILSGAQRVEEDSPLKYGQDNRRAAQILKDMAAAMAESDPEKRKEMWEKVAEGLNQMATNKNYTGDYKGYQNDVAQLIFNMVYDSLGEDGFKDALKQGLIPQSIANNLAMRLTVKADENMTEDFVNAGNNGPGWTHQMSADFLTTNSTAPASGA